MSLQKISRRLADAVDQLSFAEPVACVYNPLQYARRAHERYLEFAKPGLDAVWLGMNPGPWGMVQTGVPFGEVAVVRDWLGIEEPISRPKIEHPKRPIQGFACQRSEVSGRRLWGWAQNRFGSPAEFFERFFVVNFCPLAFLEESGRNLTPDKLPAAERQALFEPCNQALREIVETLQPKMLVGIGKFAETRARAILGDLPIQFGSILHPSPASPAANRGWESQAEKQLIELGLLT